jgi:hypothetical protein
MAAGLCLSAVTGACSGTAPVPPSDERPSDTLPVTAALPPTPPVASKKTAPSAMPTATATITRIPTATQTPTLAPDAWQLMPVVPAAGKEARRIYGIGLALKNDPHAFSILGDCLSLPYNLFGEMG